METGIAIEPKPVVTAPPPPVVEPPLQTPPSEPIYPDSPAHASAPPLSSLDGASAAVGGLKLKEQATQMILDALANSATRQEVSDKLGISPRTLRYKIARLKEAGYEIPA